MASALSNLNDDISLTGSRNDPISTRAGYLPISLTCSPIQALTDIPVYIRTLTGKRGEEQGVDPFTLFTAGTVLFDEDCRQRLLNNGVKFVYVPTAAHERYRRQTESQIENIAADPQMAAAAKWAVVYETSAELASELLSQRSLAVSLPRLQNVSRAVANLVLKDPSAFAHLFAASHHDFYTATHMVNVGTWMVALAYAMGYTNEQELCSICQAGVLHDVGKTLVPKEILNKTGPLTDEEWASLRSHAGLGQHYLLKAGITDPIVLAVAMQHHERLDGSGYPAKLRADDIHPISRLCAVVDTFDAMTSLRPFKTKAMPVADAVDSIFRETPLKYDPKVISAWTELVKKLHPEVESASPAPAPDRNRRKSVRSVFNCPVLVKIQHEITGFDQSETIAGTAMNISAAGMMLLLPLQMTPGQTMQLHLEPPKKVRVAKDFIATSVRCRAYDDGWFEVGVTLMPCH